MSPHILPQVSRQSLWCVELVSQDPERGICSLCTCSHMCLLADDYVVYSNGQTCTCVCTVLTRPPWRLVVDEDELPSPLSALCKVDNGGET